MTGSTLLGLLLQGMAVCLVHVVIRGRWVHHVGALLLLMAISTMGLPRSGHRRPADIRW